MLIPAIAVAALYGLYRWDQKRKTSVDAQASAARPAATPSAENAGTASGANNTYGSITHTPPTILPGFNVPIQHVAVPKADPGTTYPPATTVTDPKNMQGTVIAYQAARPVDSGTSYYPAAGDLWGIISARLGGTPKARIVDPKNNSTTPLKILSMADVGKLNGIVSLRDFDNWLKAGKPLKLPLGGWNDVSGPVPNAMGSIR